MTPAPPPPRPREASLDLARGLAAPGLYVLLALPLTALWFRTFSRSPLESLWRRASGPSR